MDNPFVEFQIFGIALPTKIQARLVFPDLHGPTKYTLFSCELYDPSNRAVFKSSFVLVESPVSKSMKNIKL